jgi:hypothetical protein
LLILFGKGKGFQNKQLCCILHLGARGHDHSHWVARGTSQIDAGMMYGVWFFSEVMWGKNFPIWSACGAFWLWGDASWHLPLFTNLTVNWLWPS